MSKSRYGRVVLKLSGEALAGADGWGVEPAALGQLADQVLARICAGEDIGTLVTR